MKRIIIFVFALLAVFFVLVDSHAGEINLGANQHSGNVSSTSYHVDASANNKEAYVILEWNYGETDNIVSRDNAYLALGYDPVINDHWNLWFFNKAGYNNVRAINFENSMGAGPKYTFVETDTYKISLSAGVVYHHEATPTKTTGKKRWSVRPKAKYEDDRYLASFVSFWQPNIENPGDLICSNELVLGYKLTDRVSVKVSAEDEYRSHSLARKYERTVMLMVGIKI